MYYILEWMLASSIPHLDGACLWVPCFDMALNRMFVGLLRLSIFKRLKIFLKKIMYDIISNISCICLFWV